MPFLMTLLSCTVPLAAVPHATRLAEGANGTVLVGTATGEIWAVDWYGTRTLLVSGLGAAVDELAAGPLATYAVALTDGRVLEGSPWAAPRLVARDAVGILWTCDGLRIDRSGDRAATTTAVALGGDCDELIVATSSGEVDGTQVSDAAIHRVFRSGAETFWVDEMGRMGCPSCDAPALGVVDALPLHAPPFRVGQLALLDTAGALWLR
jgi:hypothetical protein